MLEDRKIAADAFILVVSVCVFGASLATIPGVIAELIKFDAESVLVALIVLVTVLCGLWLSFDIYYCYLKPYRFRVCTRVILLLFHSFSASIVLYIVAAGVAYGYSAVGTVFWMIVLFSLPTAITLWWKRRQIMKQVSLNDSHTGGK